MNRGIQEWQNIRYNKDEPLYYELIYGWRIKKKKALYGENQKQNVP